MVPRPENEGTYSENELMVQKVPSIYSNSEGEDCARLVKNGQLDNFTPVRSIKRQEISHFVDGLDSDSGRQGRSTTRRLTQRSKSEHRGRTVERDTILQRGSRSSSRDQIKVGDRVIIKDKYIGTCRYVGPIEEQDFQLPEIWYGVELDEKLTNNSGIFGSREYFSCAFGHGLMVLGAKIRKVKSPNVSFKNGPSTTTLRPSKSMSNLTTRTKVSIGADNWESRSRRRKSFNNQHPMATLNRIKQLQAMQPAGYSRDPYRALLETFQQGSTGGGYAHDNLMRRSFERIVSQESPDYGLSRNQSLPVMQNSEKLMAQFGHLQRSTSAPHYRQQRRPSFMSTGSGSISQSISYNQEMYYRTSNGAQLCKSCSSCKTCAPVIYNPSGMPDYPVYPPQKSAMSLPRQFINRNQSFDYPVDQFQRKVAFTSSSMSDSSSGVSSSASSTSGSTSSLDEDQTMQSIEYEKWKSVYGLQRGRQMKKGLSKLSAALHA